MNYDHIANRISCSAYFSCEVDTECKNNYPHLDTVTLIAIVTYWPYKWMLE